MTRRWTPEEAETYFKKRGMEFPINDHMLRCMYAFRHAYAHMEQLQAQRKVPGVFSIMAEELTMVEKLKEVFRGDA